MFDNSIDNIGSILRIERKKKEEAKIPFLMFFHLCKTLTAIDDKLLKKRRRSSSKLTVKFCICLMMIMIMMRTW